MKCGAVSLCISAPCKLAACDKVLQSVDQCRQTRALHCLNGPGMTANTAPEKSKGQWRAQGDRYRKVADVQRFRRSHADMDPGKGGLGLAVALILGGLRCAPTPLRCSAPRPHRVTFRGRARCRRATGRALRWFAKAYRERARCGRATGRVLRWCWGWPGRASEVPRSAGRAALARSATPPLTRRRCLSAESAANVASSAAGPRDRASQGSRSASGGHRS